MLSTYATRSVTLVKLAVAGLALAASGAAQALLLTGADLLTDPNVVLPNGNAGLVGNSLQFTGPPTNSVQVNLDLNALGFGTGPGQATSGSVAVTNTRVTSDSDLWFGLWDGVSFPALTSWDGSRSATQPDTVSDGLTFDETSGSTVNFSLLQGIGEQMTATYTFDLIAGTTSLSVGGIVNNLALPVAFDSSANLSFLIGRGSTSEIMQIDQVEIPGLRAVPEPGSLALLGLALGGVAYARRGRRV